jgi:hypothetical protein
MAFHGYITPKGRAKIEARDQSTGAPASAEAQQVNISFVEMQLEKIKAWKLANSLPDIAGAFNSVADMTAEEEAMRNAVIEVQDAERDAARDKALGELLRGLSRGLK